jgi:hypothetical protein
MRKHYGERNQSDHHQSDESANTSINVEDYARIACIALLAHILPGNAALQSAKNVNIVLLANVVELLWPDRRADFAEMRFSEQQHLHP